MSQRTVYTCDRCRKEVEQPCKKFLLMEWTEWLSIEISRGSRVTQTKDLCSDCSKDVQEYLKSARD